MIRTIAPAVLVVVALVGCANQAPPSAVTATHDSHVSAALVGVARVAALSSAVAVGSPSLLVPVPALAAFLLLAPPALPQAAAATQAVSEDYRLMVDALIAALESGGGAALDRWIERYAVLRPTKGAESWRDWFGRVARTSGGLTLERLDPPRADGELRVWVKTGRGGKLRRFGLFTSPDAPGQATDFVIAVWPTPYDGALIHSPASEEQLAELVRDRVAFGAARDEFSGAAVLASSGRPVAQAATGTADQAAAEPVTTSTRFHIGSMGKMFTAVAIGKLIEGGRLRFDTRLIEVLPEYPDQDAARQITVAQLLSHSSGISLPHAEPDPNVVRDADPSRVSDSIPAIAAAPLAFPPGSGSSYSNEGYTILGAVIEAVTGRSYYDAVQSTVFDPAGMKDTAFDMSGPGAGTAVGYRYAAEDALGVMPREPNTAFIQERGGPSGGAYSTIGDLTAFLNAFRDGRLVSPAIVTALLTPEPKGLNRYGKGFTIIPIGERRAVGHSGGGPNSGINADAMILWETGWSYAVAGNYDAPAAQAVAGALLAAAAAQP